jgi:hypothetical protein
VEGSSTGPSTIYSDEPFDDPAAFDDDLSEKLRLNEIIGKKRMHEVREQATIQQTFYR